MKDRQDKLPEKYGVNVGNPNKRAPMIWKRYNMPAVAMEANGWKTRPHLPGAGKIREEIEIGKRTDVLNRGAGYDLRPLWFSCIRDKQEK